jgi:hypothetical protein
MTLEKPYWEVSYQGGTVYRWRGGRFEVRSAAWRGTQGYTGMTRWVGTVENTDNFQVFPPSALVALFPGYVGARWDKATNSVLYDGPAPQVTESAEGVRAVASLPDFGN